MIAEKIDLRLNKQQPRLEVVDNAHQDWAAVAKWIERSGESARVLDKNGWLSARQIVVAAFKGDAVIGHLGFRVDPVRADGKIILDARIDSVSIADASIERPLFDRAQAHARLLGCRDLKHEND